MAIKICVYTICKNESQFVDRWLSSMSEADYIVVLDTGSTDGTYEMLKNDDRVTRVEQMLFSPWRFDDARNESLKLVPSDADVLCAIDLDEVFEPGWAEQLRWWWAPNKHSRCSYKYAWSHDAKGNPERIFKTDKIHDSSWTWKYPVHETLYRDEPMADEEELNLFDNIYLHHYADNTKSRTSYLDLLRLRYAENPDDLTSMIYLAHQLVYASEFEEGIQLLTRIIEDPNLHLDSLFSASCWLFLGDAYKWSNNIDDAIRAYSSGIDVDPTYRENYMNLAQILNENKRFEDAVLVTMTGIDKSYRHFSWIERDQSWTSQPWDILSIAYYYLGLKELSKYYIMKALEADPTNDRIKVNADIILAE